MNTTLIVLGVVFLVIGGLLYFVPLQSIGAQTTTSQEGDTSTQRAFASVIIPPSWSMAIAVIGTLLLVIGLVIPAFASIRRERVVETPYSVIETKKDVQFGGGKKRRVMRERSERHVMN